MGNSTSQSKTYEPPATSRIEADHTLVYVGTYTRNASQGIYLFRWQAPASGTADGAKLLPLGLVAEVANPSFLEIDPRRRLLFTVTEDDLYNDEPGAVRSYAIDPATGGLSLRSERSSRGAGPCHLVMDPTGRNILVANYTSGSVAVMPILPEGRLGEVSGFDKHAGRSVRPDRQAGPHAHCVTLDPANRFAFVCDLGLDKVHIYKFDPQRGTITPASPAFAPITPGAGPRHMVFGAGGRFAYVINELNSTITVFAYDAASGQLRELQNISTLPADFKGESTTSEIEVYPSGKFLYGSNRGHDSVALFAIDPDLGTLSLVDIQGTSGKTPRHFAIDPTGRLILIGNEDSDAILLCAIDAATGRLQPLPTLIETPVPVCMKFLPPANPVR